jgi:hypothetical protein
MNERPAFRNLRLLTRVRILWRRATRSLAEMLPKGLYKRSLLIVIAPMVLLQTAVTFVFMQHHWDLVTRRLSEAVARDVGALTDLYQRLPPGQSGVRTVSYGRVSAAGRSVAAANASIVLRRVGSAHPDPSQRD